MFSCNHSFDIAGLVMIRIETDGQEAAFYISLSTTYGINICSSLNKLEYFHVCNFGLPPDVMHDLLEGHAYTMELLLNQIINKEKFLYTFDYLNNLILYFNYGANDARNKPNCLTTEELASDDHGLNQSGI